MFNKDWHKKHLKETLDVTIPETAKQLADLTNYFLVGDHENGYYLLPNTYGTESIYLGCAPYEVLDKLQIALTLARKASRLVKHREDIADGKFED